MSESENGEKATLDQITQFMTTEHFTLQTARSATVAEANGRISLFIGAVSGGLVALAFAGQMSQMNESFYIFALVLFPSLIFLGFVTFNRVLQTALEDWVYVHKIDRIRHYYAKLAPQVRGFFNDSLFENPHSPMRGIVPKGESWQFFLTASGMVSGINSILIGVFAGLLCKFVFQSSTYSCAALGIIFFAAGIFIHYRRQIKGFTEVGDRIKNFLPFEPDSESKN